MFFRCKYRFDIAIEIAASDTAVLLWQKVHCEMDTVQMTTVDRQITWLFRATGQHNGIVIRFEIAGT